VRAVASAEPSDALDGSQGYTGERVGAIAYNPALDGIRALAVLAVLLFHENWGRHDTSGLIPGGFIGVDMFFVLSGFLITALLLRDHAERGRVVSVDFWARRVRRLLPALLVLVGLVSLYAAFVAAPHQLGSIKRQGISALFYVENWAAITSRQASLSPFSHLWSLSVEEQWYLVWPLMLGGLLALTRGRVRHLLVWIGLLAAGSFVLMIVLFETVSYHRATAGTDTRAWQLLLGSGLAVVVVRGRGVVARSRATRIVIEVAAAVSLLFLVWVATQVSVSDRWPYDGGLILVGLATIVLVVAALQPQRGVAASLLSWPPLVWIGLISYGLYLYHLVVYVWLSPERVGVEGAGLLVLRLAVVFGLAATSYLLIERPIRRGTARIKAAPVVAVASFLGAVGLLLVATVGAEPPPLSALTLDHYRALAATTPPGATRVLVVGDETVVDLGLQVPSPVDRGGIRGTIASGCTIAGGTPVVGRKPIEVAECPPWPQVYREARDTFRPDVVVLMTGTTEVFDREVDGRYLRVGGVGLERHLRQRLERLRRLVTRDGRQLVLLTVPCAEPDQARGAAFATTRGDHARVAWVNRIWRDFAAAHPDSVRVADLDAVLCPGGVAHAAFGTYEFRPNGVNLSPTGAVAVWGWIAPIARAAAGQPPVPGG